MSFKQPEHTELPPRKVVFSTYAGPNSGLGQAVHTVYAWVGTYYKDRVSDVTVCYAGRPTMADYRDSARQIEVEIRFDLDEYIPLETKLPPGLEIKQVSSETIISEVFKGPLPEIAPKSVAWLERMAESYVVAPGHRRRTITMAKSPTDPSWEIEMQLVLE